MNNGPKLWNKLLNEAELGPRAIIMGGAIVDYVCNEDPKDFDIFHTYTIGKPELPDNWELTDVDFNDPVWIEEHQELYLQGIVEEGKPNPIGSVYEYMVDDAYKVQLIGVHYENPRDHFKNFDHSLTLGWYSVKGLFIHRRVFDSFRDDIIEYVGKNKSQEARQRSLLRAKSKAARYGGEWSFVGFEMEDD